MTPLRLTLLVTDTTAELITRTGCRLLDDDPLLDLVGAYRATVESDQSVATPPGRALEVTSNADGIALYDAWSGAPIGALERTAEARVRLALDHDVAMQAVFLRGGEVGVEVLLAPRGVLEITNEREPDAILVVRREGAVDVLVDGNLARASVTPVSRQAADVVSRVSEPAAAKLAAWVALDFRRRHGTTVACARVSDRKAREDPRA